jgi:hypothetical protein
MCKVEPSRSSRSRSMSWYGPGLRPFSRSGIWTLVIPTELSIRVWAEAFEMKLSPIQTGARSEHDLGLVNKK